MTISRRYLLKGLSSLPALSLSTRLGWAKSLDVDAPSLPDKTNFTVRGTYLDAAFTHPMGSFARSAYDEYLGHRTTHDSRIGPGNNARNLAVELFAKLINADAKDIAVVPSTMEGENLIGASLGLGKESGVVTDALHYDASLVMYGELAKRGMPLKVVQPRGGGIELRDIGAAITKGTRLVAVSLVSNVTGFHHDLKALCDLAHSKGTFVFADIIQAAGAVPVDVKASGVDFCSCGTYKWLMGDFGTAFLYVRPDRLGELRRVQVGWQEVRTQSPDDFPSEKSPAGVRDWMLDTGAAGIFEVSTPAWGALACVARSLAYIHALGVDAIVRHCQPLIEHLSQELPKHGFRLLTPSDSLSPIVAFSYPDASARFTRPLRDANIKISLYQNRIRISPSVYNTMEDAERLVNILST